MNLEFYRGKKVLLTGHTGFKGAWMSQVLINAGANLLGYSLESPTIPSLFQILNLEKKMTSVIGDIRDLKNLINIFNEFKPEIVIHMAAQPLVRDSYKNPVYTYETNVMGTVNIMEAVRLCPTVKSFLNVTTDKVYKNNEWHWGYRECDALDGYDPYSNSKSCSELVTNSYKKSFFDLNKIGISTARAGNVIGGGDFSVDRIIPDCIRAAVSKEEIILRNPYSTRPYQHVLEPISAYLLIAMLQYNDPKKYSDNYNVGPDDRDCVTTGELADIFCNKWGDISWKNVHDGGPHEASFLKLDCSKIKSELNWKPKWNVDMAVEKTVEWVKVYSNNESIEECVNLQIKEYFNL